MDLEKSNSSLNFTNVLFPPVASFFPCDSLMDKINIIKAATLQLPDLLSAPGYSNMIHVSVSLISIAELKVFQFLPTEINGT